MNISKIARSISQSATLKLNERAATLRKKGEPVIHLGAGEPKTKAPQDALIAAARELNTGEVRYTPTGGIPDLKKAIIHYTEEFYGRTVTPDNVMASGGAKQAIVVALQAILDPGDELLFPAPYWVSYPEMAKLCGAKPVPILPADGSFYPTLRDIEQKVGPRSKAIIINSPNNPTGAMYSEAFIADIVEFCERRDLYLIMDDIYHRLIFDGRKPISCYDFARVRGEDSKLIVVNGISKQYAMTGFRIGWAVAHKDLIGPMTNIQGHQTSGPSVILQRAAVGAINGIQSSVEELRRTLETNRNTLVKGLQEIDGVRVSVPDGTFYCFADFSAFDRPSALLAEQLLRDALVVAVPGSEFGGEDHLRFSFCGSEEEIIDGMKRVKWYFDPKSPPELDIGGRILHKGKIA